MTLEDRIEKEVQALGGLDLEGLRSEWRRRKFGATPKLRSPTLLRYLIGWRIQAQAFGGIDAASRRRIRTGKLIGQRDDVRSGVRITREWRGATYEVTRDDNGYQWEGRSFRSLSAVAFAITGVKQNGPAFFGLRKDPAE